MDQDNVVAEQLDGGRRLAEALQAEGIEPRVAFWCKPTEDRKWFLYLASPAVDEQGATAVYRTVHRLVRQHPDFWIDPFEVRVIGVNDQMGKDALEILRSKGGFPGMTRFGGDTLGRVEVDGVIIYPQQPIPVA